MAAADAELRTALANGGEPVGLAARLGIGERELTDAFESVARRSAEGVRLGRPG
jgi:hypothetical protein